MSYYEIITGDGKKVFRERIELSDLGAFGKKNSLDTSNSKQSKQFESRTEPAN